MAGKECVAIASDRRLGVQLVREGVVVVFHCEKATCVQGA